MMTAAVVALGWAGAAGADIPKKVQAKFKGQILITDEDLPEGLELADAVKAYKKLDKSTVKGEDVDGVRSWQFNYTAFLKSAPKAKELTLDFHTADKENLYIANKRLELSGTVTIVSGRLSISEDDGPSKGKTYHLILRARQGGKEVELARTKLRLD
jgi:hypothetical protein